VGTAPESADWDPKLAPVLSGGRIVTALLVVGLIGLACLLPFVSGRLLNVDDVVIAAVLYVFTGFGISVGFHRLLTHRSFKAKRPLKIVCALAGSMALEGSAISWVACHRRHHMLGAGRETRIPLTATDPVSSGR
jgi:stearoyl-CoA desaturase (Delta-9 desaturase)